MLKIKLEEAIPAGEARSDAIKTSPLFDDIIARINETSSEVLKSLNSTNPDAKESFLGNPALATPPNRHDNLDKSDIESKLTEIKRIESVLARTSSLSKLEDKVLELALKRSRAENVFLLANANYLTDPTRLNAELHRFANEALYGRPDHALFLSLLSDRLALAESTARSKQLDQEYQELQNMLGPIKSPGIKRYQPRPATVKKFSEMARNFFEPILKQIPDSHEQFTSEEAAEIANRILAEIAPTGSAWHAVCDPDGYVANVSNFTIRFPGKRSLGPYSRRDLEKILVHELGTHAVRALPYEHCKIKIFRSGLPGYEKFEEGLACVAEQAMDAAYSERGAEYYITSGLVYYLHTNFRETFEIMRRLNHLTNDWNDSKTFDSVQRALRGTDVLANNKDFAYFYGNTLVWHYIENNLGDPLLFEHLFASGKTNYSDPAHEKIATAIKNGEL